MTDFSQITIRLRALDEADSSFPLRQAVASILFMIMPVDGETHPKELERLRRILADDFDLDEDGITHLITQSKMDVADQQALERAAEMLRAEFHKDQLMVLISHMWEMVFADGRLHEAEVILVESVAKLLDLSPEDVVKTMDH